MAEQVPTEYQSVELVKEVRIGFFQTTYGILIKRLIFNAIAVIATTFYDQLNGGGIDWQVVQKVLATQFLYIVMTFTRDVADPKLPNSTKAVEVEPMDVKG